MKATTQLYRAEGRENLQATLKNVSKATSAFDVGTVVIFAAFAESVLQLRGMIDESRSVVSVTFPAGFTALVNDVPAYVGITSGEDHLRIQNVGVTQVRGVMPFWALGGAESNDVRMFRRALELFGGGLELCVQAILMGCDAGAIQPGERCIAMSADTAIVAHAENAFRFLTERSRFAIEHIICKPIAYSITRSSVKDLADAQKTLVKESIAKDQPVFPLPANVDENA